MNNSLGGEVTSIKFYTGKWSNIDENGLLSESIFGPLNDFRCRCGKLNLETSDSGKICDKCGVLCGSSDLRLKTFGKISLIFPVIKTTKRKYFKKIVGSQHKHLLDPKKADASLNTRRYLSINNSATVLKIVDKIDNIEGWFIIPIRITGLYSFILSLKFAAEIFDIEVAKELFEKKYIIDVVKVLPPDLRPIMRDPKKRTELRYVEINKHYISLINQNNQNKAIKDIIKQKEYDWFEKIKYNITNNIEDEIIDVAIPEYDTATARYQYYVDQVYESAFESISGKTGLIRSSILGKTIEFSARSVIIIDPSLEPYKVKVSRKILYKLWFPYFLYYLGKFKEYEFYDIFDIYVQERNYEENKTLFNEFLEWFCQPHDIETHNEFNSVHCKILIKKRQSEQEIMDDIFE